VLERLQNFRTFWEESTHEPTRVNALYLKYMERYLRAKKTVSAHDSWLIEIESADWMGPWKMIKKRTYLQLQCEYMETFYDDRRMPALLREIMRANVFCVGLSRASKSMSFDECNKNYNMYIKQT
jgi:hypothetical protein